MTTLPKGQGMAAVTLAAAAETAARLTDQQVEAAEGEMFCQNCKLFFVPHKGYCPGGTRRRTLAVRCLAAG